MRQTKKITPVKRLMDAAQVYAVARGNAEWLNGYRAGISRSDTRAADAAWPREVSAWKWTAKAENEFHRLAQRLLREARRA